MKTPALIYLAIVTCMYLYVLIRVVVKLPNPFHRIITAGIAIGWIVLTAYAIKVVLNG